MGEKWLVRGPRHGGAGAGLNSRFAYDYYGTAVAVSDELYAVGAPGHGYDDAGVSSVLSAGATFTYFR